MHLIDLVIRYFDLESERRTTVPGGYGSGHKEASNVWLCIFYLSVLGGIAAKLWMEAQVSDFSWVHIIRSLIIATLVFPAIYKQAVEYAGPRPVQACISFAGGFGYQALMDVDAIAPKA